MRIVVVGCGRVGGRLAVSFEQQGHSVVVIDRNPRSFRHLSDAFNGEVILGMGIDEDVLRAAGIESADAFIAVTDNDNTNIMAAQIARTVYRIPQVLLRIYDPVRADIYRSLGLNVICPTTMVAATFEEQALRLSSSARS